MLRGVEVTFRGVTFQECIKCCFMLIKGHTVLGV